MEGMDGEHLVVNCTINDQGNETRSHVLIDSGATGFAFVDEEFAISSSLPLYSPKEPRELEVIDGRPIESGLVTAFTKVKLTIDKHVEEIHMFVTKLGHYPLVLGIPWLNKHDIALRFRSKTVNFDSDYCLQHCSPISATTKGISIPVPEGKPQTKNRIAMIAVAAFLLLSSKNKELRGSITVYELLQAFKKLSRETSPDTEEDEIRRLVPQQYHDFLLLFKKGPTNKLPPHWKYDHTINLKPGFEPSFGPLYGLSREELLALKE
jgi:predicted aspartyl protease